MKRWSNEMDISEAISYFMKKTGNEKSYKAASVINSWEEVMGPAIAKRTSDISFYQGTLQVRLTSAPLKNELSMSKEKVVRLINEHLNETIVMNIVLW